MAPVLSGPEGAPWQDGKRYMWLTALMVPLVTIAGFGLWHRTEFSLHWWITPLFVFVAIPLMERTAKRDSANVPEVVCATLEVDRYYRWCAYLYLLLAGAALLAGASAWSSNKLSPVAQLGVIFSVGTVTGVGITTAHELGHKRSSMERWLARLMLAATCYGHFYVEHNRGHHVRVATSLDPASARLGETFWRFWPRSVFGALRSAWALEAHRLRLRRLGVVSLRNEVLLGWLLTAALFAALILAFGSGVLIFLAAQAIVGISLLEGVNYIQHYGLSRAVTASGRPEKVGPQHSWNSDAVITNLSLFQLQRHSDHHTNPTRPYQTLRSFPDAPQLPASYAALLPIVFVPRAWFAIMNDRVVERYDGDVTRANIAPYRRTALVEHYHKASMTSPLPTMSETGQGDGPDPDSRGAIPSTVSRAP
ncbi:alkane 1-monooxygenase [Parafrankia sp. FMc2]|uniref:alkane 1-monooxygenase n=1 Tax=Parafrankia sp. FMc2 TaxID=3233196 RepID=UPI0034D48D56